MAETLREIEVDFTFPDFQEAPPSQENSREVNLDVSFGQWYDSLPADNTANPATASQPGAGKEVVVPYSFTDRIREQTNKNLERYGFNEAAAQFAEGIGRGITDAGQAFVRGATEATVSAGGGIAQLPADYYTATERPEGLESYIPQEQRATYLWMKGIEDAQKAGRLRPATEKDREDFQRIINEVLPAMREQAKMARDTDIMTYLGDEIRAGTRELKADMAATYQVSPEFAESWMGQLAMGAGSMAPMLLFSPSRIVSGASLFGMGYENASSTYDQWAQENGVTPDPETRFIVASTAGTVTAALERIGIDAILGRVFGDAAEITGRELARRITTGSVAEGLTEALDGISQDALAKVFYNPEQDVLFTPEAAKRRLTEFTIGAVLGGTASGAHATFERMIEDRRYADQLPVPRTQAQVATDQARATAQQAALNPNTEQSAQASLSLIEDLESAQDMVARETEALAEEVLTQAQDLRARADEAQAQGDDVTAQTLRETATALEQPDETSTLPSTQTAKPESEPRGIREAIRDKDTVRYDGRNGFLFTDDYGNLVFRPQGTNEEISLGTQAVDNRDIMEIEGLQYVRRGESRAVTPVFQEIEQAAAEPTFIEIPMTEVEDAPDDIQVPQILEVLERDPGINHIAGLLELGDNANVREGRRKARPLAEQDEYYRQLNNAQIRDARRSINTALRVIDGMRISEEQKTDLAEPWLRLDEDIDAYEKERTARFPETNPRTLPTGEQTSAQQGSTGQTQTAPSSVNEPAPEGTGEPIAPDAGGDVAPVAPVPELVGQEAPDQIGAPEAQGDAGAPAQEPALSGLSAEQTSAAESAGARIDGDATEMLGYPAVQLTLTDPGRETTLYVLPEQTPEQIQERINAVRQRFVDAENEMMARVLSGNPSEIDIQTLERRGLAERIAGEPVLTDAGQAQLPPEMRPDTPSIEVVPPEQNRPSPRAERTDLDLIAEAVMPMRDQLVRRAERSGMADPEIVASQAIDRVLKLRRNEGETDDALADRAQRTVNSTAILQAIYDAGRRMTAQRRDVRVTTSIDAPVDDTGRTVGSGIADAGMATDLRVMREEAQAELVAYNTLERAALVGDLLAENLIERDTAYDYIQSAISEGATEDSIRAAIPGARAKWAQRSGDMGTGGRPARTSATAAQPERGRVDAPIGRLNENNTIQQARARIAQVRSEPNPERVGASGRTARMATLEDAARKRSSDVIGALPSRLRDRITLSMEAAGAQAVFTRDGISVTPFRAGDIADVIDRISDEEARIMAELVVDEELAHAIEGAIAFVESDALGQDPIQRRTDVLRGALGAIAQVYAQGTPETRNAIDAAVTGAFNTYYRDKAQNLPDVFGKFRKALESGVSRDTEFAAEFYRMLSQAQRLGTITEQQQDALQNAAEEARKVVQRTINSLRTLDTSLTNPVAKQLIQDRIQQINTILNDAYQTVTRQNIERNAQRQESAIAERVASGMTPDQARASQRRTEQAQNPAHTVLLEDVPESIQRSGQRLLRPGLKYALWQGMMIAEHGDTVRPMLSVLWDSMTRQRRGQGWHPSTNRKVVEDAARAYFDGVLPARVEVRYFPNTNVQAEYRPSTGTIMLNAALISAADVPSAIEHELGHLIYEQNPEFRGAWEQLWNELTPEAQAQINDQVDRYYQGTLESIQGEERVVRALQVIRDEARNKSADHPLRQAWERFIAAIVEAWRRLTGQTPNIERIANSMIEAARAQILGQTSRRISDARTRYSYVDTSSYDTDPVDVDIESDNALPVSQTMNKLRRTMQLLQQATDRRGNPTKIAAIVQESLYKGDGADNLADMLETVTALTAQEAQTFAQRVEDVHDLSIRILQAQADAALNQRTGHAIATGRTLERRPTALEAVAQAKASAALIAEQINIAYDRDLGTRLQSNVTTTRQLDEISRSLAALARQVLRTDATALTQVLRGIAIAQTGNDYMRAVSAIDDALDGANRRELAREARTAYLRAKSRWNTLGDSAQAILSDVLAMFSADGSLTAQMRERLERAQDAYNALEPEKFFVGPKKIARDLIDFLPRVNEEFKQHFRDQLDQARQPGEIKALQSEIVRQMAGLGIALDKQAQKANDALSERLQQISDYADVDRLEKIAIRPDVEPEVLQTIRDMVEYAFAVDRDEKGIRALDNARTTAQVAAQAVEELAKAKPVTSIINSGSKEKRAGIYGRDLGAGMQLSQWVMRMESILRPISPTLADALYGKIVIDGTIDKLRAEEQLTNPVWDAINKSGHPRGTNALPKWLYEIVPVEDGAGTVHRMRRSELWSIALSARNEYNLRAMAQNGVVLARQRGSAQAAFKIDGAFLANMESALTAEDRMVMDAISAQFNGRMRTMLSSTLRNMGKPFEIVENYFPIKTDWVTREAGVPINTTLQDMVNQSLTGAGFLKARSGIRAAVEIGDALDTFLNHADRSSSIYAYLEPYTEAQKLLNRSDVKQSLARVIGETGTRTIINRLEGHVMPPSPKPNILNRGIQALINRAAPTTLALSLGATLLNFSSLPLAASQIRNGRGMRYLVRAIGRSGINNVQGLFDPERYQQAGEALRGEGSWARKAYLMGVALTQSRNYQLLMEYSPAARERYNDFANQMSSGLINHRERRYTKTFAEKSMFTIEWTDKINAVIRYDMAQQYIRDARPDLAPGTPEFYEAAAREWTALTYQTENSSHGGDMTGLLLYSRENPWLGAATVFTSAPSKILSLILEGTSEIQQGNSSRGRKLLGAGAASLAIAGLLRALIDSARGTGEFKDDEEEDERTKLQRYMDAYLKRTVGETLGVVPVLGPLADSFVSKNIFGDPTFQRSGNYALDIISSFGEATSAWMDVAKEWEDVNAKTGDSQLQENVMRALNKSVLPLGIATSIPLPGAVSLGKMGWRALEALGFSKEEVDLFNEPVKREESASQEAARFVNSVLAGDSQEFLKTWEAYRAKRPDADWRDAQRLVTTRFGSDTQLRNKQEASDGKITDDAVEIRAGEREAALDALEALMDQFPDAFEGPEE